MKVSATKTNQYIKKQKKQKQKNTKKTKQYPKPSLFGLVLFQMPECVCRKIVVMHPKLE
jgi:hypothetical protein